MMDLQSTALPLGYAALGHDLSGVVRVSSRPFQVHESGEVERSRCSLIREFQTGRLAIVDDWKL